MSMSHSSSVLAVIFDFDDMIVPDSTTKLLKEHEIDPQKYWSSDVKALVPSAYDSALAYLTLLLDNIGADRPIYEKRIEESSLGAMFGRLLTLRE